MSRPEVKAPSSDTGLGTQAARGVLWTGGGQIVRQLMQIGGQLVLVRLLTPDDFGLLGMSMFFIGIGQLLTGFGIGSAIVQSQAQDRVVLSSCFWLNLAVAGSIAAVTLAAAPAIGRFYHRADLAPVLMLLTLNLLLSGLEVMPRALLYRDMRFADLVRAEMLASACGLLAAIGLAWAGAGVWALAAQPLVGSVVTLLACWRAQRWLPGFEFNWQQVAPIARFSFALLGTNLAGYANRNVDSLLIGRVLGAGPLGLYAMAIQLMLYPMQQVTSVIVRVLFPTLVQIKDDLPRLRSAYLKAVAAIALITFPLMAGLFALADDFVMVAFGPTWAEMTPVLKVLCLVGMMQSVGATVGTIYLSTGNPNTALRVSLIGIPVLVAGIAAGMQWGIEGVAIGYAAATILLFYYVANQAFRLIDLTLGTFCLAIARPLLASLLMCAVLFSVAPLVSEIPLAARFGLCIIVGATSYVAASLAINGRQLLDLWRLIASLRR